MCFTAIYWFNDTKIDNGNIYKLYTQVPIYLFPQTPSYILNTVLLKILENLTGFEMILKDLKTKKQKKEPYMIQMPLDRLESILHFEDMCTR